MDMDRFLQIIYGIIGLVVVGFILYVIGVWK